MKFTDTQLGTISNALRVAAERFEQNAGELVSADPRLSQQFNRQASEAMALYDLIGEKEGIQN